MSRSAEVVLALVLLAIIGVDVGYAIAIKAYTPGNRAGAQYGPDGALLDSPTVQFAGDALEAIKRFLEDEPEVVTALSTAVIAWYTLVLARATKQLQAIGEKQSADMRESLRIASESAAAAKKSADVAEASLKDLERPWVYWNNIVPFGIFPPGAPTNLYPSALTTHTPTITFSLINVGRMPAIMSPCFYKLALLESLDPAPVYKDPSYTTSKGILQAGKATGQLPVSMKSMTLSGDEWKAIKEGSKFFFFFGYIKYSDVFSDEYTLKFGLRHYLEGSEQGFFEYGGRPYNDQLKAPSPSSAGSHSQE